MMSKELVLRSPVGAGPRPSRSPRLQCHASSATPVKVNLRIPYRVNFGQSLGVVGAGELLGCWEGGKAVPMKWTPGDFWEAEITVEPGSATQLEYKYVVLNKDGVVSHWKPGQNYKLDVLAAQNTKVLVVETWDDGPRHVQVDMAGAPDTSGQGSPAAASKSPSPGAAKPAQPSPAAQTPQATATPAPAPTAAPAPDRSGPQSTSSSDRQRAQQQRANGKSQPTAPSPALVQSPRPSRTRSPTPVRSTGPLRPRSGSPMPRLPLQPSTTVIQQEAQVAMSELKDALQRQVITISRVGDPTSIEVIMGDRLLAAANSKAVAMNRAVRAAEALPMLPPGTDVQAHEVQEAEAQPQT